VFGEKSFGGVAGPSCKAKDERHGDGEKEAVFKAEISNEGGEGKGGESAGD